MLIGLIGAHEPAGLPTYPVVQPRGAHRLHHRPLSLLTHLRAGRRLILYMLHHIVGITNLYLVSGIVLRLRRTTDMAGSAMYRDRPLLAGTRRWCRCSPLGGRAAAVGIPRQAGHRPVYVRRGGHWIGGILIAGVLTLLSMARPGPSPSGKPRPTRTGAHLRRPVLLPIALLSAVTVVMTFAAEPLFWLYGEPPSSSAASDLH